MKKSKFPEQQIAFALQQVRGGGELSPEISSKKMSRVHRWQQPR